MGTRIPKVSIGMPVYNAEKYLPTALTCMLAQEYEDFELIICDNASSDRTADICREFAEKDSRIRYYRNETNIGATGNYNRVFELSRGEFFKWAAHDDESYPAHVRMCMDVFAKSPSSTVLVYSKAELINELGQVTGISPDRIASSSPHPVQRFMKILRESSSAHPLWGIVRASALRKTRLMGRIEADHILLAELALLGTSIEVPELLHRLRMHERNALNITRNAKQLLAWHDPKKANTRILLPYWERAYLEYIKGVMHTSLSPGQRVLCLGAVPIFCYSRRFLRWSGPFRARFGLQRRKAAGTPRTIPT